MSDILTLGSLFDGSGGFPLGGILSGIKPVWSSEIEPFPIRVTTKRLPFVKHYGDVSTINGAQTEPVDIITFGSPCQDLSIAGKRAGLQDGARSNLFYQAIRIIKEMREKTNGKQPRFAVWENVPGAFSSNKGEDFRCVLEALCKVKDETVSVPECKKWLNAGSIVGDDFSVAWRVLDAQYWGVPQRRKRIYLVADFDGGSAEKILFEPKGLSGYSSQSFSSWQEITGSIGESIKAAGFDGYNGELTGKVSSTLGVNCGMSTGRNGVIESYGINRSAMSSGFNSDMSFFVEEEKSATLISAGPNGVAQPMLFENHSQDARYKGPLGVSPTISSNLGMGGNNQPLVTSCFDVRLTSDGTKNARNNIYETDTSRTLDTGKPQPEGNQGGIAVVSVEGNGSRPSHHGDGYSEDGVSYTLNATEHHAVAFGIDRAAFNQGQNAQFDFTIAEESEPTIVAKGPGAVAHPTYTTSKASYHTIAEEEVANTLVATDYKDPPVVNDTSYGFYPQMKAECTTLTKDKSVTLVNGTNPGYQNGVVDPEYIVRRLTPTECARLQGFPDWWCDNLGTEHPSDEEVYQWYKIFETHRNITGTSSKPKTDKQIRSFLKEPHSDSAEYKMWGNGVALPCVYFVLSGIVNCVNSAQF